MPGGEVELRCFTVPCHTHNCLNIRWLMSPLKMLSPCLNAQWWKKFPLKRIIRLINYSINDLSSFPKSLMIWVSLVFESDPSHWSLKFDVLQSVSSLTRLKLCNRSFCIHALAASVTLPNNFLHWMPIFWHLFSTFMHTWRASVITQTVHESCVLLVHADVVFKHF